MSFGLMLLAKVNSISSALVNLSIRLTQSKESDENYNFLVRQYYKEANQISPGFIGRSHAINEEAKMWGKVAEFIYLHQDDKDTISELPTGYEILRLSQFMSIIEETVRG